MITSDVRYVSQNQALGALGALGPLSPPIRPSLYSLGLVRANCTLHPIPIPTLPRYARDKGGKGHGPCL